MKKGLKAIFTPLIIGILLDSIVQFNLFHKVALLHESGKNKIGSNYVPLVFSTKSKDKNPTHVKGTSKTIEKASFQAER